MKTGSGHDSTKTQKLEVWSAYELVSTLVEKSLQNMELGRLIAQVVGGCPGEFERCPRFMFSM